MSLTLSTLPYQNQILHHQLPSLAIRIAQYRCQEAEAQNSPNQDFAVVQSSPDNRTVSFCVCDGVGGSFHGEFAAQCLAKFFVPWLMQVKDIPMTEQQARHMLTPPLQQLAVTAQREVQQLQLPATLPLVWEVLAELQATIGSETVFFAGRLVRDPTAATTQLCCFWMGNVAATLVTATQTIHLNSGGDDRHRWSTRRGVCGQISYRLLPAIALRQLIIFSDGLVPINTIIGTLSDAALAEQMHHLRGTATSDDMTALDLRLTDMATATDREEK